MTDQRAGEVEEAEVDVGAAFVAGGPGAAPGLRSAGLVRAWDDTRRGLGTIPVARG